MNSTCPVCKTTVSQGCSICPACRSHIAPRVAQKRNQTRWCPTCASIVSADDAVCPTCKMPLTQSGRANREVPTSDPKIDADLTGVIPKIDTALPQTQTEEIFQNRRVKPFMLAASFAIVFTGVVLLLMWHPWNTELNPLRATTPFDTTQAGFPGEKESLNGQDHKNQKKEEEQLSPDERFFQELTANYEQFIRDAELLDENQKQLALYATQADETPIKKGYDQAQAISYSVSNTIKKIEELGQTDVYGQDVQKLLLLGNYLRNRCDGIVQSWSLSLSSKDRANESDKIFAPITGTGSGGSAKSNKQLFDQNKALAQPQKKH